MIRPPSHLARSAIDRLSLLLKTFRFSGHVLGENDGFREFPHWSPQPSALIPKPQIGFFLRKPAPLLKNPFCPLHQLPGFELTSHVLRFFKQTGILFRKQ